MSEAGFSYKGVDIYKITNGSATTGTLVPYYSFKGTSAIYNSEIPLDYGFLFEDVSSRNYTTARTSGILTSSGSVTLPIGCKHISFVGRAGGGGGGGVSGSAKLSVRAVGETTATSGSGGIGGSGNYVYGYYLEADNQTINYTIGTGGSAGPGTSNSSNKTNSGNGRTASSLTAATPGGHGNATVIKFSKKTNYSTGLGGNGGAGGNGARANFNIPSGFRSSPGNAGAPGNTPGNNSSPLPSGLTYNPLNGYGGGGPSASKGGDGALLIIYLYE